MKDLKVKLDIKSIIKFEQLANKSFYKFEMNEEDIIKLYYCCVITNNDLRITLEDFKTILLSNKKIFKNISDKFNIEVNINNQFIKKCDTENNDEKNEENKEIKYIKDIVALLIVNANIDINYIMNEISINDLEYLLNAYNNKFIQEMDTKRLFTYLSILPHVDGKKLKGVKDLIVFPWEDDDDKKIEITIDDFEKIMEDGKNIYDEYIKEK